MQLNSKNGSKTGYTLIELAIVITIVGIMIGAGAASFNIYQKNKKVVTTTENIRKVMNAVSDYLAQEGRYPCPSRLNAQREDTDYGMEVQYPPASPSPTSCIDPAVSAGTYSNGIYVEQGTAGRRVLRGAVPFRILNMSEYMMLDGYNDRLEYVVVEGLASLNNFNKDHGAISIVDNNASPNNLVVSPADGALFLILSHGEDKKGAYGKEGTQLIACSAAALDRENCNTASDSAASYISAPLSTVSGVSHFDDYVGFYPVPNLPFWIPTSSTGYHIRDSLLAGSIGIGHAPDTSMALDVNGDIYTPANSSIDVVQICDTSGACFDVDKIINPSGVADMNCSSGSVAAIDGYGITGAHVVTPCTASNTKFTCPPGQVMTGISNTNSSPDYYTITCDYPPTMTCQKQTVNLCMDPSTGKADQGILAASLPAAQGVSQTVTTGVFGALSASNEPYNETYKCQNGSWVYQSNDGICAHPDTDALYTKTNKQYACWAWYQGPGEAWFGNYVTVNQGLSFKTGGISFPESFITNQSASYSIPAFNTGTSAYQACGQVSSNVFRDIVNACPIGQTGEGIFITNSWSAGNSPSWSTVEDQRITDCTACTGAMTPSETVSCPEGYTGSLTKEVSFTCPATWGTWPISPTSGSCTCTPTQQTRTRVVPDPAGSGNTAFLRETRSSTCPGGVARWSAWSQPTSNKINVSASQTSITPPTAATYAIQSTVNLAVSLTSSVFRGEDISVVSPSTGTATSTMSGTVINYITDTSNMSTAPGAGPISFTGPNSAQFSSGQNVYVVSAGDSTQYMYGQVSLVTGTSATSYTPSASSKTFTLATGLSSNFPLNDMVLIYSRSSPGNWAVGRVTNNTATITIDSPIGGSIAYGGTATLTDWNILDMKVTASSFGGGSTRTDWKISSLTIGVADAAGAAASDWAVFVPNTLASPPVAYRWKVVDTSTAGRIGPSYDKGVPEDPVTGRTDTILPTGAINHADSVFIGVSTTALTPALGNQAFAALTAKKFTAGRPIFAVSRSDPTQYMLGQFVSYPTDISNTSMSPGINTGIVFNGLSNGTQFATGAGVVIFSQSDPASYMAGTVSGTPTSNSITVNVTSASGATALADWKIVNPNLTINVTSVPGTVSSKNDWDLFVAGGYHVGDSCLPQGLHRACYGPAGKDTYFQYKDCICATP